MAQSPRNQDEGYIREMLGQVSQGIIDVKDRLVERANAAQQAEERIFREINTVKHELSNHQQVVYPRLEALKQQLDAQKIQIEAARVQLDSHKVQIEGHIAKTTTELQSVHEEIKDLKGPVQEFVDIKRKMGAAILVFSSIATVLGTVIAKVWGAIGDRVIHSIFGGG